MFLFGMETHSKVAENPCNTKFVSKFEFYVLVGEVSIIAN